MRMARAMLRGILSVLQLYVAAQHAAEAKRDLAWAAAAGVLGFVGVMVAMLFASVAVFLGLQPLIAPAWAALAAAGTAVVLGALPLLVLLVRRTRARRRAAILAATAAAPHSKAENAMLIGTLASAFLSGIATGAGQRAAARNP